VPDFFKLHTGGYAGLIGAGVGYSAFDDVLNVALLYGFAPASEAGENTHTLHLTLAVRPFDVRLGRFRLLPIYAGGGLLYVFGSEFFTRVPERYPRTSGAFGYYPPTALHWTAHVGAELDWLPRSGFFERHGAYAEITTLDSFLFSNLENRETVDVTDAVAIGIGYRAAF
jgi:hypothetical protein